MNGHDAIVLELVRNVPAAMAVILTVWLFLRSSKQQAKDQQERLMAAAQDCHGVQARGTDALVKHAEAAAMQAEAIRNLTAVVAKCSRSGDG